MKKVFQRFLKLKKKWLFISLGVFFLLLIYIGLSMFMVKPAEISLLELRRSFQKYPLCHEACSRDRASAASIIVSGLKSDPESKIAENLKKYIINEHENIDFRLSLLGLIRTASGADNIPEYLKKYISEGDNVYLRAGILKSFNAAALSEENNPLDYYFKILAGNEDLNLKLAAIKALSSMPGKNELFSEGQLELIKKLIFNSGTEKSLRRPLTLLLSDYYQIFPDETKNILNAYYLTDTSGDNISRAFAADIINRQDGGELTIPEISSEEWGEYYNN